MFGRCDTLAARVLSYANAISLVRAEIAWLLRKMKEMVDARGITNCAKGDAVAQ
jgi:hypothetical protein